MYIYEAFFIMYGDGVHFHRDVYTYIHYTYNLFLFIWFVI